MKFKLLSNEPYVLKIENVFTKKISQDILDEAVGLKNDFSVATIQNGVNKKTRDNQVIYYDNYYLNKRDKSVLLKNIGKFFANEDFGNILRSSKDPIRRFPNTNYHETQVSRYGDNGQKYEWHIDNDGSNGRLITFVYYFNVEPKKYQGGNIVFSSSPITDKLVDNDLPQINEIPQNNTGYIFDCYTAHTVLPTTSPKKFKDGRFSVNCWIGIK